MRGKILIFFICFIWIFPTVLLAEKSIVLSQENAPLKITKYEAKYSYYERRSSIRHSVSYKNVSDKKIVAFRLSFLSFTVFNEFLDTSGGISVEELAVNEISKGTWEQAPYRAHLFKKYGTGIAYVNTVRFEDGTIWKVNNEDVLPQIQEIEESFTADLLEEKKEK